MYVFVMNMGMVLDEGGSGLNGETVEGSKPKNDWKVAARLEDV